MNEEHFSYRKLVAYQHARVFNKNVYLLLSTYPIEERFALCSQLRRAASSIPINIAESSGRISPKEKQKFIEYAFGSLSETMCQLELSLDLGYISQVDFETLETEAIHLRHLLSGLYNSYN